MLDVFPPRSLPGPQAENWGRKVEDNDKEFDRRITQLEQSAGGDNRALASQLEGLAALVRALPYQVSGNWRSTGFGISGSYTDVVSGSINVPAGKTVASILAIGSGSAVDATTGGLTTAYGRCIINGSAGGESPAAKDHGSSAVNNVITSTAAATIPVTGGGVVTFSFQMFGLNGSAFPARPSNYGQIAIVASFSS